MSDDIKLQRPGAAGILEPDNLGMDDEPDIQSLRPERLEDYVGQREVVETLNIAIEAALKREEPLEHVLFHGPPGLGKTTLAHIIAKEMGGRLTVGQLTRAIPYLRAPGAYQTGPYILTRRRGAAACAVDCVLLGSRRYRYEAFGRGTFQDDPDDSLSLSCASRRPPPSTRDTATRSVTQQPAT